MILCIQLKGIYDLDMWPTKREPAPLDNLSHPNGGNLGAWEESSIGHTFLCASTTDV